MIPVTKQSFLSYFIFLLYSSGLYDHEHKVSFDIFLFDFFFLEMDIALLQTMLLYSSSVLLNWKI